MTLPFEFRYPRFVFGKLQSQDSAFLTHVCLPNGHYQRAAAVSKQPQYAKSSFLFLVSLLTKESVRLYSIFCIKAGSAVIPA